MSSRKNAAAKIGPPIGQHLSMKNEKYFDPLYPVIYKNKIIKKSGNGEYLSSECTTCHHAQGLDEGIPSITGWPIESFVWALHSYKSGARNHPIMEMITQRLSNEEIASLAIFFESINN